MVAVSRGHPRCSKARRAAYRRVKLLVTESEDSSWSCVSEPRIAQGAARLEEAILSKRVKEARSRVRRHLVIASPQTEGRQQTESRHALLGVERDLVVVSPRRHVRGDIVAYCRHSMMQLVCRRRA